MKEIIKHQKEIALITCDVSKVMLKEFDFEEDGELLGCEIKLNSGGFGFIDCDNGDETIHLSAKLTTQILKLLHQENPNSRLAKIVEKYEI